MEKHNVRILVCTHKEGPVRDDDIYMPVQVGKSASTIDLGCQGDDVGDNISGKNKTYCELTGLYWAWKNLKDVDYIGLCHYRRYFDLSPKKYIFKHIESDSITWECFVKTPSTLDFADVFTQYDVILPTARVFDRSVVDEHIFNSGFIDYMILEQVILKLYPAYRNSVLDVFYKKNYIPQRNMFIMKRNYFIVMPNGCFPYCTRWRNTFVCLLITTRSVFLDLWGKYYCPCSAITTISAFISGGYWG